MYWRSQYVRGGTSPRPPGHLHYRLMAIYHLSAKIIGRKAGQSSVACAAYRAGEELADKRTGETFRFARSERVAHTQIIAPGDAPTWALDRADLWNQVEARERRKDAQLAREFEVALPRELTLDQQRELVCGWIEAQITPAGAVVDLAIHHDKEGNNPHAHIMTTLRAVSADGWGAQKLRQWEDRSALAQWRASWAEHTNAALERAGVADRVDHRSHADRDLKEEPSKKEGPAARAMEARGLVSDRMEANRRIRAMNLRIRERLAKAARKLKEATREAAKLAAIAKVRAKGPTAPIRSTVRQQAEALAQEKKQAAPAAQRPDPRPTQPTPEPAPPRTAPAVQVTDDDGADLVQQAWWLSQGVRGVSA